MVSSTHFLPVPPPILTSARYATDLNEVKAIGKSDSATRTPEQTTIARIWASIAASGAPGTATHYSSIWNNIAGDIARDRGLSLVETARLFVLMNVSIHDALQTTLTSKFIYGVWRPVTAIRQADTDLNPATDPDPTWSTLIPTPPYPSYAGNMATIGASAARVLALALGTNDVPVTATWRQSGGQPDVVQHFATLVGRGPAAGRLAHLRRHPLPFRQRGRPDGRTRCRRVRVREFHETEVGCLSSSR